MGTWQTRLVPETVVRLGRRLRAWCRHLAGKRTHGTNRTQGGAARLAWAGLACLPRHLGPHIFELDSRKKHERPSYVLSRDSAYARNVSLHRLGDISRSSVAQSTQISMPVYTFVSPRLTPTPRPVGELWIGCLVNTTTTSSVLARKSAPPLWLWQKGVSAQGSITQQRLPSDRPLPTAGESARDAVGAVDVVVACIPRAANGAARSGRR
jgi:hypothetical protein